MSDCRKKIVRDDQKPLTNSEIALDTIKRAERCLRLVFSKGKALRFLAPYLGISPRHLYGLEYQEPGYTIQANRHAIRMGVVKALRAYANWVDLNVVDVARREADAIECHERQLTLWRDPICSQPSERRSA